MTRRRLGIIAIVVALVVLAVACIVLLVRNYKPQPVARPCLLPSAAATQELRTYAATTSQAETIADGVDTICVLEGSGSTLTMRYYEDDDGFADFVPYALATSHLRHLTKYRKVTGTPDAGQRYAMHFLMFVRSDGTLYPPYKLAGTTWVKDDNPVSHPGALVTQARYGSAPTIPVKTAFNQAPPSKYSKGASNLVIGSGTTSFEGIRSAALTPSSGKDDHKTHTSHKPSAIPSPTGTRPPGASTARPGKPAATTTAPSTRRTTRTN